MRGKKLLSLNHPSFVVAALFQETLTFHLIWAGISAEFCNRFMSPRWSWHRSYFGRGPGPEANSWFFWVENKARRGPKTDRWDSPAATSRTFHERTLEDSCFVKKTVKKSNFCETEILKDRTLVCVFIQKNVTTLVAKLCSSFLLPGVAWP